ncbi:hypothetical protein B566_EDAN012358 [Ephemera danica]|nr:hypothetical protein B566_EDAN012358 [Ephemera danica]
MCSLREAVIKNGLQLEQQQLTSQLVPIIVETCIDFIATHGCDIEGLYENEQDNDMTIVSQLLSRFRIMDAREIHLDSFNALDVATALKIFFASLPNPLFSKSLTSSLVNIAHTEYNAERRAGLYRVTLQEELSQVQLMTSRKLLGHLHLLHLHSEDNKMDATRLAATWTSALMPAEHHQQEQQRVLAELIAEYPLIYAVSCEEIAREVQMQTAVRKFRDSMKREREHEKPSSLNIWISIGGYFSTEAVQVKVTNPNEKAFPKHENISAANWEALVTKNFIIGAQDYFLLNSQDICDVIGLLKRALEKLRSCM